MRRLRQCILLILILTGHLYFVSSRAVFWAVPSSEVSVANGWEQAFADDFEVESNWSLFEEIVGGNPCYGVGIGSVARSRMVSLWPHHDRPRHLGTIHLAHTPGSELLASFIPTIRLTTGVFYV
jgi:hypothetical protein